MKLQRREKILLGLTLGLVVLAGLGFLLFAGDSRSDDQLIADRTKLEGEIETKQKLLHLADKDAKRLAQWQQHSLPSDPVLARSLYQNWLRRLTARANLRGTTLVSPEAAARRDQQFTRISFTLSARAKLDDLVQFMYEFYAAGFLHQIRDLKIKPVQSSRELDVRLAIEALSLPTAESKDRLPKEAGKVLQFSKLSDYREPIVSRDFFAAYVRPAPSVTVEKRIEKTVDLADYAVVTAFIEVDGAAQVWIRDRIGGKPWKLGTGENFTVGKVKGTVESIRPEGEVVVEFGGHRRSLRIGDNLHGGVEIQDPPPKRPDEGN